MSAAARAAKAALVTALFSSLFTAGCGGVRYLAQAARGQLDLVRKARPIAEVLRDETTPPRIRALLGEIGAIKAFGEAQGLKPTSNYTDYVALDRPAVVWVVSACEPLRFKSKEWHFPIAGSFPYLGWFSAEDAKECATQLKREGLDVDIGGASAYSTLGWFRDAVLSSMLSDGDEALGYEVNVILHESTHATVFIQGQAYFNESLASFVADRLTPVYLEQTRGPGSPERLAYEKAEAQRLSRAKRLHEAYEQLGQLYASSAAETDKLKEKARLLSELRAELGYKKEINNATLAHYRTYNTGQAELDLLFRACGSGWSRFLGALRQLKPESFSRPQQEDLAPVLVPLAERGC